MNILVTGSKGFIGKNLVASLKQMPNIEVLEFDKDSDIEQLKNLIEKSDFIYHLAGVNRPKNNSDFYTGNSNLTKTICDIASNYDKKIPILITSSAQVGNNSDYSKSKALAEEAIKSYSKDSATQCFIYRLPNVFGKWSRPNYNSVVATWCHNIARDIDIKIDNPLTELNLVYIDDVVDSFLKHLYLVDKSELYCKVDKTYNKSLQEIQKLLYSFKNSRETLLIEDIAKDFTRALYATYLSYIPTDKFSYKLSGHTDDRGTFYELIKTQNSGQLSLSTTKANIVRGGHFHHTKNEKFLVVKGEAIIELRDIFSDEIIEYKVSSNEPEIVEMIPGYTHNIRNVGDDEMVLIIWANENYDPNNPDTYALEV